MLKAIKNLFASKPEAPAVAPAVVAIPDPRGAPGTRVYHEYFVDVEPKHDGFHWLCRVYAQNGACTEKTGVAANQQLAKDEAIDWANRTKAGLRGE